MGKGIKRAFLFSKCALKILKFTLSVSVSDMAVFVIGVEVIKSYTFHTVTQWKHFCTQYIQKCILSLFMHFAHLFLLSKHLQIVSSNHQPYYTHSPSFFHSSYYHLYFTILLCSVFTSNSLLPPIFSSYQRLVPVTGRADRHIASFLFLFSFSSRHGEADGLQ